MRTKRKPSIPEATVPDGPATGIATLGAGPLAAAIEVLPAAVAIIDNERCYRYVNPAACTLLGYEREELLGKDFLVTIVPREHERMLNAFTTRRSGWGSWTLVRKNGEEVEVSNSIGEFTVEGEPLVIVTLTDVSEQRRRERELQTLATSAAALTVEQPLATLLDDVAARLVSGTAASGCLILLLNEQDRMEAAGSHGLLDGYAAAAVESIVEGKAPWAAKAIHKQETVVFSEVQRVTHEQIAQVTEGMGRLLLKSGWDTIAFAPMVFAGQTRGLVTAYYDPGVVVDSVEHRFLQAFADHAAVAVETTRLINEARQRRQQADTLAAIAASLTFDQPTGEILSSMSARIVAATGAVAAAVTLVTDDDLYKVGGTFGLPAGYLEELSELYNSADAGPLAEALGSREPFVVRNVRAAGRSSSFYAPLEHFLDDIEWDTVAVHPLLYADGLVGRLSTYFRPNAGPGDDEMAFLATIAAQAAVAVENARLFEDSKLRRVHAETLADISASLTFDQPMEEILKSMTRHIVETTGAVAAVSSLRIDVSGDSLRTRVVGVYGIDPEFVPLVNRVGESGHLTLGEQALAAREIRLVEGSRQRMLESPAYEPVHAILETQKWDTSAWIPVVFRDRALGVISAHYTSDQRPSDDDIALIKAISDQAAVAVENARLFGEARTRRQQAEAVAEMAARLTFNQSVEEILDAVATSIVAATRAIAASSAVLPGSGAGMVPMKLAGLHGFPEDRLEDLDFFAPENASTSALAGNHAVVMPDARQRLLADPRYSAVHAAIEKAAWEAVVFLPVIYQERQLGLLTAAFPAGEQPTEDEIAVLKVIADQAAIAVENVTLFNNARGKAALEERQRLARELHDSVSQALYGIALGARTAKTQLDRDPAKAGDPIDYVLSLAEAGLAEMRALIFELRPESLETEGLVAALEKQAAAARARHALAVTTELCAEPEVSLATKEALYRVAQEATQNVARHARATTLHLRLAKSDQQLVLEIRDNGRGFDPGGEYPGHLGLRSMSERVSALGGELEITSQPDEGTTVQASIPLTP